MFHMFHISPLFGAFQPQKIHNPNQPNPPAAQDWYSQDDTWTNHGISGQIGVTKPELRIDQLEKSYVWWVIIGDLCWNMITTNHETSWKIRFLALKHSQQTQQTQQTFVRWKFDESWHQNACFPVTSGGHWNLHRLSVGQKLLEILQCLPSGELT